MENKKLPVLQDLYNDTAMAKKENQLNILLNNEPKKSWLRMHPVAKNVVYIPIERIEFLLTNIFLVWNVEVKEIKLIANSVVVTVRLHYKDPVTQLMQFHDGIGAAPLQTDKGSGAIEFDKIKNNAVMLAAPSAESYAIKDAAEKLGKLFGKDLNRSDKIMYDNIGKKFEEDDELISQQTFAYIESLISTSNNNDEEKERLELELTALTVSKYEDFIEILKDNQLSPAERGNMSQTEIKDQLSMKMNDPKA